VRWLLRFIGWATALLPLCWLASRGWQRGLGAVASALLRLFGLEVEIAEVQLQAPFDLGIYAAMCLAGYRMPWRDRLRGLAAGLPLLLVLEVAVVSLSVALMATAPAAAAARVERLTAYALETVPWLGSSVVWLAIMGARVLPLGGIAPAAARREDRPRTTSGLPPGRQAPPGPML
jgi:hypothetical protein